MYPGRHLPRALAGSNSPAGEEELFDLLKDRRSIRKYRKTKPDPRQIDRIIDAAVYAPSAHNAQPWRFYDADSPAEYMKLGTEIRLSVVAFRWYAEPISGPAGYCRRLVAMKYPGVRVTIDHFSVTPAGSDESPIPDAELAYRQYRHAVEKGELPELGVRYESYHGPGPDRAPVTALFFPTSR